MKLSGRQIIVFLALTAAAPVQSVRPGQWEITNSMSYALFNGQRHAGFTGHASKVCLSPEQASLGPGLSSSDPEKCVVKKSSMRDGHYEYTLECKKESGDGFVTTTVSGTYENDNYEGEGISTQKNVGMTIEMHSRITAHRVGDC